MSESGTPALIETLMPASPRGGLAEGDADRIKRALVAVRARFIRTREFVDYYDGHQPLTYTSESYRGYFTRMVAQFRENICPAVIDALADRLQVTAVNLEATAGPELVETPIPGKVGPMMMPATEADTVEPAPLRLSGDPQAAFLWSIWRTNRMHLRAGRVHKDAAKLGDAFVIVWPDAETNSPRIYTQDSRYIYVHYDPETEAIDWAAKFWIDEESRRGRVTLYFRDELRRYQTREVLRSPSYGLPGERAIWQRAEEDAVVPNQWDRVPVFHFANDADIGEYGQSELRDVIPIQDALNKAVADMLVAMEFAAYPQRWATGLTTEVDPVTGKEREDFKPGIDRLWRTADEMAKFGDFTTADLAKFIEVRNSFKAAAADVAGIPAHYMQMTPGAWPSGESLKTSEARFVAKVTDRQIAFGNTWSDVLTLCAAMAGVELERQVEIAWKDASPRSDTDAVTVAIGKVSVGVSQEQAQRELGYSEEEIARMRMETQAKAEADSERKMQELNAQPDFGSEPA